MPLLSGRDDIRVYQERYKYFFAFVIIFASLIVLRLWYLQIFKGWEFQLYAEKNRIWQEKDRAPRGMVYDRNGVLLVDNRPSFDIIITPQYLTDKDKTIKMLAGMLKISKEDIELQLAKAHSKNLPYFYPVVILEDVDRDRVGVVEINKLFMSGVDVILRSKRTYLYGSSLAHTIGYIGEVNKADISKLNAKYQPVGSKLVLGDLIGKFGIEYVWDIELRGIDGAKYVEVDANGRRRSSEEGTGIFGDLPVNKYVPGYNIVLTLDHDLQQVANKGFAEKKGAVIALDPRSGEVLVMLSSPGFDPTDLSKGITTEVLKQMMNSPFRPFYNKTIQDHFPPGSTYKPVIAMAALEEGIIDESTTTSCRGKMWFGGKYYHCHSKGGHGNVNMHDAIIKSCDIYFYRLGMRLGVDKIFEYANKFGLGKPTGIKLPHETRGLIPSSEWKESRFGIKWTPGETLSAAIGQSYDLVTPIQMANLYAGIATGKIFRPYIVKRIEDYDGAVVKTMGPELRYETKIKEETREILVRGLTGVVNERGGTALAYRLPDIEMAGKTGTVQLFRIGEEKIYQKCDLMEERFRHHGWFIGFAPAKNPEIVVAVIAEHSCHGSSGAAPVVRDIIRKYYEKYILKKPMDLSPETTAISASRIDLEGE